MPPQPEAITAIAARRAADLPDAARRIARHVIRASDVAIDSPARAARAAVARIKLEHVAAMVVDGAPSRSIWAHSIVFDLVCVLVFRKDLPLPLYRLAADILGPETLAEIIDLVGLHALAAKVGMQAAAGWRAREEASQSIDPIGVPGR